MALCVTELIDQQRDEEVLEDAEDYGGDEEYAEGGAEGGEDAEGPSASAAGQSSAGTGDVEVPLGPNDKVVLYFKPDELVPPKYAGKTADWDGSAIVPMEERTAMLLETFDQRGIGAGSGTKLWEHCPYQGCITIEAPPHVMDGLTFWSEDMIDAMILRFVVKCRAGTTGAVKGHKMAVDPPRLYVTIANPMLAKRGGGNAGRASAKRGASEPDPDPREEFFTPAGSNSNSKRPRPSYAEAVSASNAPAHFFQQAPSFAWAGAPPTADAPAQSPWLAGPFHPGVAAPGAAGPHRQRAPGQQAFMQPVMYPGGFPFDASQIMLSAPIALSHASAQAALMYILSSAQQH
eukprot:tig00020801_g13906.t1